jgi:hypothetical protein
VAYEDGGESAGTPDSVRGVSLTSPNAWKRLLSSHFVFRCLSLFVVVAQRPEDKLRTERHGSGLPLSRGRNAHLGSAVSASTRQHEAACTPSGQIADRSAERCG